MTTPYPYGTAVSVFPEPTAVPPRMRIQLLSTEPGRTSATLVRAAVRVNGTGGSATVTELGAQLPVRQTDGTNTVPLIPQSDGTSKATVYDYLAPLGQAVHYVDTDRGAQGTSNVATLAVDAIWFVHLSNPALSTTVQTIVDDGRLTGVSRDVNQGVTWVMGRERPITITDGVRKAPSGTMIVRTYTGDAADALQRVLHDASTIYVQIPATRLWGVGSDFYAFGKLTERRVVRHGPVPLREFELPFVLTDQPVSGLVPTRTYADVLAQNGSYAAILAKYPSYQSLLTG